MTPEQLKGREAVDKFITMSEHPLKDLMQAVRNCVLATDESISEHIKWNAPAFYYNAEMAEFNAREYKRDIVVFNVRKDDSLLLIFPTGNVIDNSNGLLEGNYSDGRRIVTLRSINEFEAKKEYLKQALRNWLSKIEKN